MKRGAFDIIVKLSIKVLNESQERHQMLIATKQNALSKIQN